jgi:phenylacetate-coenzyme A ligase PaaK-like adenylate-forming protein
VIWLASGITAMLMYARLGRRPLAWFTPVEPLPFAVRAGARYVRAISRLAGRALPGPVFQDLAAPGGMVEHLAALLSAGKRVIVTTYSSSAVRISAAARDRGTDLRGICYLTLGEPFTEGKQRIVVASGAQALVSYGFAEGGIVGFACGSPHAVDDVHVFTDGYGLAQRRRSVGDGGPEVDALLVTSLLPSAPKILLNVETGDYGVVERRECGCAMGACGLTTHLSHIRSFEKLSGEGMTFVQTDLIRVLEDALPARFGGTGADYQVLEHEEDGITRLSLIISPRVGELDAGRARDVFLEALGRRGGLERMGAEFWRRAQTVVVRREWPKATSAGKILPFQIER